MQYQTRYYGCNINLLGAQSDFPRALQSTFTSSFVPKLRNQEVALVKMASARFCTRLWQVLPSASVTAARLTAIDILVSLALPLPQTGLQSSFISSSVDHIANCTIVFLVLVPIALQKWGSSFTSFLTSSIATKPVSGNMQDPFPEGRVFFLEWPTWARLAIVSSGAQSWQALLLTRLLASRCRTCSSPSPSTVNCLLLTCPGFDPHRSVPDEAGKLGPGQEAG